MFTQNIINNYLQIPGIDGMLLAMPEIFIFCSTLILMILDIFFFKEKSFKNTNKFGIFIIIIAFFLALLSSMELLLINLSFKHYEVLLWFLSHHLIHYSDFFSLWFWTWPLLYVPPIAEVHQRSSQLQQKPAPAR